MDLERIKQLAKKIGGVFIFNGDQPELIVLTYEKFKELGGFEIGGNYSGSLVQMTDGVESVAGGDAESFTANGLDEDRGEIERLNQEISVLKEEIRQKESAELVTADSEGGAWEESDSGIFGPSASVD